MSGQLVSQVFREKFKDKTELLIMLAIADLVNEKRGNVAWPSISTLAKRCICSESTVHRTISKLVKSGKLSIERGGGRKSNHYRIIIEGCHGDTPGVSQRHRTPVIAVTPNQIVPNLNITRGGCGSAIGEGLHLERVKKNKLERANELRNRYCAEVAGGSVHWSNPGARTEYRTLCADARKLTQKLASMG